MDVDQEMLDLPPAGSSSTHDLVGGPFAVIESDPGMNVRRIRGMHDMPF